MVVNYSSVKIGASRVGSDVRRDLPGRPTKPCVVCGIDREVRGDRDGESGFCKSCKASHYDLYLKYSHDPKSEKPTPELRVNP